MILGGLDIASTTGAAVLKEGITTAETIKIPVEKLKFLANEKKPVLNGPKLGRAFLFFEGAIRVWFIRNGIEKVAIEEPLRTNFSPRKKAIVNMDSSWAGQAIRYEEQGGQMTLETIFKIHGLEAVAVKVAAELNIPVVFVNQASWRLAFLGHGRPADAKQLAKKECLRRGITISSLDAAEACGIVDWLDKQENPAALFRKPLPKTPAQEQARADAEALFRKDA